MANINMHKSHNGHFCASSYRLGDINILNFDIENIGQGHVIEKRDLRHSITNIKVCESRTRAFIASSHSFSDILYLYISRNFDLENIIQGLDVQHSQWRHSMANT